MKKVIIIVLFSFIFLGCQSMLSHDFELDITDEESENIVDEVREITFDMENSIGFINNWNMITPFGNSGDLYYEKSITKTLQSSITEKINKSGYFKLTNKANYSLFIDLIEFENELDNIWSGTFNVKVKLSVQLYDLMEEELLAYEIEGLNSQRNLNGMQSLDIAIDNAFSKAIAKIPLSDIYQFINKPKDEQDELELVLEEPIIRIYEQLRKSKEYKKIGSFGIVLNNEMDKFYTSILIKKLLLNNDSDYEIIDRTDLDLIFNEQKLRLSGVVDDTTLSDIGEISDIDIIITGEIIRNEVDNYLILKTIDVEKALVIDQQILDI